MVERDMKGIVWFVVIPIVMAIVIPMALFLPIFLLRIHLVANIEFETKIDSGQLIMMSLLSSTVDGKPVSQIISEHVAFASYQNINQILSEKMSKYSSCYMLSAGNETLAQSPDCNATKYVYDVQIPLPYNHDKTSTQVELVIE
jgi:hypothetical protein